MKSLYHICALLGLLVTCSSCSTYRTVGGDDVALIVDTTSMVYSNSPTYYQGRKNDYDYFITYVHGRKLKTKCPIETTFIKNPHTFSKEKSTWTRISTEDTPDFMPTFTIGIAN